MLLRDPGAAGLAIYGATVLDPAPPPLGRRGAAAAAVRELSAWPAVPTAADLLRRHKLLRAPALVAAGLTDLPPAVAGDWRADPAHWSALRAELSAAVAAFCARDPLAPGMPTEAARASLRLPARDLVTALVGGDVVQDGGYLRISTRQASRAGSRARAPAPGPPTLGARSARSAPTPPPAPHGFRPPSPPPSRRSSTTSPGNRSRPLIPNACAGSASTPRPSRRRPGPGCCSGWPTWSCSPPTPPRRRPRLLAELDQPFTTSQARQALRTSRRVAIPLLEYLDRARITERLPGDLRRIRE